MNGRINTSGHTVIYKDGQPDYVVMPYADYEQWLDETTTIPHDVVALSVKHNCNLIGAWRRYRGLSQTDLANKMGISQSAVAQMEKVDNPQGETLKTVAAIFNCDVEQLKD